MLQVKFQYFRFSSRLLYDSQQKSVVIWPGRGAMLLLLPPHLRNETIAALFLPLPPTLPGLTI